MRNLVSQDLKNLLIKVLYGESNIYLKIEKFLQHKEETEPLISTDTDILEKEQLKIKMVILQVYLERSKNFRLLF